MSFDPQSMKKNLHLFELGVNAEWAEVEQAYDQLIDVWRLDRFEKDKTLQEKAKRHIEELTLAYDELKTHWNGLLNTRNDHLGGTAVTYGSAGFPHQRHAPGSVDRHQSNYGRIIRRTLLLITLILLAVLFYAFRKGLISLDQIRLPKFSTSSFKESFPAGEKKSTSSGRSYRVITPLEKD